MSGCQEEEGVSDGSSATQPSHASVIILVVAVLIGAPVSGPAVASQHTAKIPAKVHPSTHVGDLVLQIH
ncbi:Hypothetical predicted protein [Scomber scombrus]|uniref:Uncharacterized protein n=1 Tax=Scomber scombrus TaxID=13677 RepID=A0AAV1QDD5_SCOSC